MNLADQGLTIDMEIPYFPALKTKQNVGEVSTTIEFSTILRLKDGDFYKEVLIKKMFKIDNLSLNATSIQYWMHDLMQDIYRTQIFADLSKFEVAKNQEPEKERLMREEIFFLRGKING